MGNALPRTLDLKLNDTDSYLYQASYKLNHPSGAAFFLAGLSALLDTEHAHAHALNHVPRLLHAHAFGAGSSIVTSSLPVPLCMKLKMYRYVQDEQLPFV